ncbi:hypothetical protein KM043_006248 [Ampulex compressa]|nr:hypothetical protein KM043_006248 [Ampulex compressa]
MKLEEMRRRKGRGGQGKENGRRKREWMAGRGRRAEERPLFGQRDPGRYSSRIEEIPRGRSVNLPTPARIHREDSSSASRRPFDIAKLLVTEITVNRANPRIGNYTVPEKISTPPCHLEQIEP